MALPKSRLKFLRMIEDDKGKPIEVWSENGKYIRWFLDVKFIGGGNDKADTWLVKYLSGKRKANGGIIILEDIFDEEEQYEFCYFHELPERCIMAYGVDYDGAHECASQIESMSCQSRWRVPAPYIKGDQE